MLRKCRRFGLRMGIAMLALLATATIAHAHGSRPSRALLRCQEQIASEGLYYSTRLNVKLARCLVPLGTCSVQTGGASHACDRAVARCLALPGDVAGIEGRFVSRVRSSCNGLAMSQLLSDLDFNSQVGECNPQDLMQFARCLAGNLKQAEVLAVLRLAPSACDFASTPGLADVLPAAACNPSDACDDDDDPPPPPPTCEGQLYCGGADGVACPDGMVCDKADGLCSETADGVCVPATTCSDQGTPVCGCDGQTYASDCLRVAAGVTLARAGACPGAPTTCSTNMDCAEGTFCDFPLGSCGEGQMGTCKTRTPANCSACSDFTETTVCGCGGNTYTSECDRMAAGEPAWFVGTCF